LDWRLGVQGKVVVITGGYGALGMVVARTAVDRGARLAILDQSLVPKDADFGKDGLLLGGVDLTNADATREAMGKVKKQFGRIDCLINIAGTFRWETLEEGDPATWDLLFKINVKTAVNASKAALPLLVAGGAGRIINVGAGAAVKAAQGMGPYAASKAGIHRFTESLSEELKSKNVTVNAVLPSIIDTPANRKDMPNADFSKWVAPSDLAAVILFLASDEAKAVTGALIPVTGRV
jgi:NAD(P)-dependent dehydrogenase (short-subunit alcohol dehydrogenase family)